ncbi:MAG: hypothetical protein BWZ02_01370 [Lentisphaerae bacterium ADurb.BinA184]|nr:MAG: hypothetical protein BWZ02_01370 [Lentisphaerae bacterium ADurb.BinA184]
MSLLLDAPVVVRVLASLGMILAVNALTRRLAVAVGAGTLTLALWCGHRPAAIVRIAWGSVVDPVNLGLLGAFFLIIWLSSQMSASGVLRELVAAVRLRVSQRASLAILPALIGMLPMPGGAAFSAPLVDDLDRARTVAPMLKTRINYWFRHPWEYFWPLYPGVLLAIEVSGLAVWQFMGLQLPVALAFTGLGVWFLLRRVPHASDDAWPHPEHPPRLLRLLSPTLAVVVVYGGLLIGVPALARANRYLPLAIGILAAMLLLQFQRPLRRGEWRRIVLSGKALSLTLLVAVIRIYGAFIETHLPDGTLLVAHMRADLAAWGLPLVATVMVLPFISGLVTGLAVGFVGASFPIVFSLLGADAPTAQVLATTALAYGFGHIGMMLSPVHVCLVVTNEHFQTRLVPSLHTLFGLGAAVLAVVCLYSFLVAWLGGLVLA